MPGWVVTDGKAEVGEITKGQIRQGILGHGGVNFNLSAKVNAVIERF